MRGWRKPPNRKRTTGIEPATLSLGSEGEPGSAGSGGHLLVEESHFPALGGCFDFPLVPVRTCQLVANQAHRGLHRLPHGLVRAHAVEQMHVLPPVTPESACPTPYGPAKCARATPGLRATQDGSPRRVPAVLGV